MPRQNAVEACDWFSKRKARHSLVWEMRVTAEMLLRCRNLSWELLPDQEIRHCYTMLV